MFPPVSRPTRRQALAAAAGLVAAPATRAADPPAAGTPGVPAAYPFKLGTFDAVLANDGSFTFPGVQPFFAPEGKPEEAAAALKHAFLPADRVTLSCNSLFVNTGRERVLVDAGCGAMYPGMGQLAGNLRTAGVRPEDVTAVVLTHAHFDHFGGLFDAAGRPAFPNAVLYLPAAEEAFWTGPAPDLSAARVDAATKAQVLAGSKRFFAGLPGKVERVRPGQTLFGGAVELVAAPGHTPGMLAVLVDGGSEQLLHVADAAHHYVLMFARPDWSAGVDQDPQQAKATRRKLFDRAAADRLRVTAAHLPFPGLGHVRAAGTGFEWVPEPWTA
jgi:glyoxylase-like metal-dependent hydrolase (beta-lactamase superfamily II)